MDSADDAAAAFAYESLKADDARTVWARVQSAKTQRHQARQRRAQRRHRSPLPDSVASTIAFINAHNETVTGKRALSVGIEPKDLAALFMQLSPAKENGVVERPTKRRCISVTELDMETLTLSSPPAHRHRVQAVCGIVRPVRPACVMLPGEAADVLTECGSPWSPGSDSAIRISSSIEATITSIEAALGYY
jgi:hypothetical protein|eukprot:jgi/Chrpa1/7159/Chrysochromulina_OHIO_Genome00018560-RA